MSHLPDFETFSSLASDARLIPVYRRILGDSLTPVLAFHKLDDGGSACLFESVIGGEKVGRYSFLAVSPFLVMEACRQQVTISTAEGTVEQFDSENPLEELQRRITSLGTVSLAELPTSRILRLPSVAASSISRQGTSSRLSSASG